MEYIQRVKQFYRFSKEEMRDIVITVFVLAFIWGFDDGNESFNAALWLGNFIGTLVIVAISVLFKLSVQKIWGIWNGIKTEYKKSTYALAIAIVICLVTRGKFPLLLSGTLLFYHVPTLRLGTFRHGMHIDVSGYTALSGPIGNIVLAMFFKFIFFQVLGIEAAWLDSFVMFNFLYAFYSMLPIPGQDGLTVYFGSRMWYVFGFGVILGYVILFLSGVLSLFGALAIGVVVWIVYYVAFERGAWGG